MDNPATKVEVMIKDREVAKQYLNYVYIGNASGIDNSTYCPKCGYELIEREDYHIHVNTNFGTCVKCGYKTNLII